VKSPVSTTDTEGVMARGEQTRKIVDSDSRNWIRCRSVRCHSKRVAATRRHNRNSRLAGAGFVNRIDTAPPISDRSWFVHQATINECNRLIIISFRYVVATSKRRHGARSAHNLYEVNGQNCITMKAIQALKSCTPRVIQRVENPWTGLSHGRV
jgi:hypothetical protein